MREVYVDVRSSFERIKQATNGDQELAQALDFLFLGFFSLFLEFMHGNTLRQHLKSSSIMKQMTPNSRRFAVTAA